MRADFEELVRRSLQARAGDVTPDPATWEKVSARIRRARTFRLALAGFAAASVVAFAVVVLPQVLTTDTVEFENNVAAVPSPAPLGPSETGDGQHAVRVDGGVVVTDGSDIDVYDESGEKVLDLLTIEADPPPISDVAVRPGSTPDDLIVLYRMGSGCDSQLHYEAHGPLTALGGAAASLGADSSACPKPAVWSPDGRHAAWVEGEPGDYTLRIVAVLNEPNDEGTLFNEVASLPLATGELSGLEIVDWLWDGERDELRFLGVTFDGRVARVGQVLQRRSDGVVHLVGDSAVGPIAEAETVLAWQAAHVFPTAARVVPDYTVVADFADDVATNPRLVATVAGIVQGPPLELPAGLVHPDGDDGGDVWMSAFGQRVVLGDGHGRVWATVFDGESWAPLEEDDAVVHASLLRPALTFPPAAATQRPTEDEGPGTDVDNGLTVEAARTRDAIIAAAEARDWDALRELTTEGFSSNFGGEEDHVAYWQRLEAAGEEPLGTLVATLQTPSAVDSGGNVVWPFAHAREDLRSLSSAELQALQPLASPEEVEQMAELGSGWLGPRAGIRPDGAWIFFILGGD